MKPDKSIPSYFGFEIPENASNFFLFKNSLEHYVFVGLSPWLGTLSELELIRERGG